jgi:hypothetical protein
MHSAWNGKSEVLTHIFSMMRPPQYLMTCVMPDQEKQRRALQESIITMAQAEEACTD